MAYRNIELPLSEGRIFKVPNFITEWKVTDLTIDEDKDYVLFKGIVDKDNPSEKPFYFYFKGEIVSLLLNGDEFIDKNTVKWKLLSINIPDSLNSDEVFEELRKAFAVYGCSGLSEETQERWKCKFNDPNPNGFAVTDF